MPDPSGVDTAAVAKELPYGTVKVTAVTGGLEVPCRERNDPILIANAAVIVSFDDGKTGVRPRLVPIRPDAVRHRDNQKTWSTP